MGSTANSLEELSQRECADDTGVYSGMPVLPADYEPAESGHPPQLGVSAGSRMGFGCQRTRDGLWAVIETAAVQRVARLF